MKHMKNIEKIFKAKSVAIVGASNKKGSIGNSLVLNLKKGYKGKIFPVNLNEKKIENIKCYKSLSDINDRVDLMLIAVPAKIVPAILEEGAKISCKSAVVISAGFKEVGNISLEKRIKEICEENNISLIGPNCLGIINTSNNLNASFSAQDALKGKIAFISQSGAICTAVLDSAKHLNIGFSKFVSVGNKAIVDEVDLFNYLAEDRETEMVAIYAEELSDSNKIIEVTEKLRKKNKPVIILKSGRTKIGAAAASSHTGALAGDDRVYDALFKQANIIRAESIEEMFNYLQFFSFNKLSKSKKIAVITNAGGPGVIAVDSIIKSNLEIANIEKEIKNNLISYLPSSASVNNPIDILGDAKAKDYAYAISQISKSNTVDSLLVLLTPQSVTEIKETAQEIIKLRKTINKPIATVFMGQDMVSEAREMLVANNIASYNFPEQAIKSFSAFNKANNSFLKKTKNEYGYFNDVDYDKVADIFDKANKRKQNKFPEIEALEILKAYNFPISSSYLVKNEVEALKVSKKINKNMVLKISSQDILHKSDAGGVELSVTPSEALTKYKKLLQRVKKNEPRAKIDGVLFTEMISDKGVEMILGSVKDPALGQSLMLGLGGIYVEVFKDVSFGVLPVNKKDVLAMINSLKVKKLLDGVRGEKEKDKDALVEIVLRCAKLISDFPHIKEIDINPVLVLEKGKGVKILDARIIV